MKQGTRRGMLLLAVLVMLDISLPVQAFSFCFSSGGNNHNRYSPYRPYPPAWPPPGAFYPGVPMSPIMPAYGYPSAYPYPYPQQFNGAMAPLPAASEQQ